MRLKIELLRSIKYGSQEVKRWTIPDTNDQNCWEIHLTDIISQLAFHYKLSFHTRECARRVILKKSSKSTL